MKLKVLNFEVVKQVNDQYTVKTQLRKGGKWYTVAETFALPGRENAEEMADKIADFLNTDDSNIWHHYQIIHRWNFFWMTMDQSLRFPVTLPKSRNSRFMQPRIELLSMSDPLGSHSTQRSWIEFGSHKISCPVLPAWTCKPGQVGRVFCVLQYHCRMTLIIEL